MTSRKIRFRDIADVIRREEAEAREKTKEAWYWGDVGRQQANAVYKAEEIIKRHCNDKGWIEADACLEALEEQRQAYIAGSFDSDGYASATIREFMRPFEDTGPASPAPKTSRLRRLFPRLFNG